MTGFRAWWLCYTGPSLYSLPSRSGNTVSHYNPSRLEFVSASILSALNAFYGTLKWTSFLWSFWFLRSVPFDLSRLYIYSKFASCTLAVYFLATLIRSFSRLCNPHYYNFIKLFDEVKRTGDKNLLSQLTLYNFSSSWPAHFDTRNLSPEHIRPKITLPKRSPNLPNIFYPIIWFIAHTIGICLTYPGCTATYNWLTLHMRISSKEHRRHQFGMIQIGLLTRDGDFVEVSYTDRRVSSSLSTKTGTGEYGEAKGNILILCCEGNSGFAEIGIAIVPLKLNYSVLSWNHPGFGASTGLPFPDKEQNAVEAALLFAIHELNFEPARIYLYGWSIGGYSASWIAMNYPEIGGLILDATFDDIDSLSRRVLPSCMEPIVDAVTKTYFDLNNIMQVTRYDGPIRVICRSSDEVISVGDNPTRANNRGTFLIMKLLKYRFPYLFNEENESILAVYLSYCPEDKKSLLIDLQYAPAEYHSSVSKFLQEEIATHRTKLDCELSNPIQRLYPSNLGKTIEDSVIKRNMLLYLASEYHTESPGRHCTELKADCFQLPWSPLQSVINDKFT